MIVSKGYSRALSPPTQEGCTLNLDLNFCIFPLNKVKSKPQPAFSSTFSQNIVDQTAKIASKSNAKEIVSCSDFLELTVAELKYYLAEHGLSQDGTKLDLAARALVAYEKNEAIRKDIKCLQAELKATYKLLSENNIRDPNLIFSENWVDDVSLWPLINLGQVFSYIINKKAFESEYIRQYKAKKASSNLMSGSVNEIVAICPPQDKVILKGNIAQWQKIREKPRNFGTIFQNRRYHLCQLLMYSWVWGIL